MERIKPITGEIYHIYNRGVDKREVFLDDDDHSRFIHDLFEFNDENPAPNLSCYFARQKNPFKEVKEVGLPIIKRTEPRKLLIELLTFCLMPNHFHLLVKQKIDNGIPDFMQKLGTGYTNYFNQKYNRDGVLFQGKYKIVRLTKESHLIHLPYYIHLNPLDLIMPSWRKRKIESYKKAIEFLESYKWSSFPDYIGKKNFPSVTQRDFLLKFFNGSDQYKKDIINWLKEIDLKEIQDFTLEQSKKIIK